MVFVMSPLVLVILLFGAAPVAVTALPLLSLLLVRSAASAPRGRFLRILSSPFLFGAVGSWLLGALPACCLGFVPLFSLSSFIVSSFSFLVMVIQLSLFPIGGGGCPEVGDSDYVDPAPSEPVINDFKDPCPDCPYRDMCSDDCGRLGFPIDVNREPKRFSLWLRT